MVEIISAEGIIEISFEELLRDCRMIEVHKRGGVHWKKCLYHLREQMNCDMIHLTIKDVKVARLCGCKHLGFQTQ